MKKIQFLSLMAVVIMALCSCTNTDYQKAIPTNATLVVKADMKSISEKADFKNSKWKTMLDASLIAVVKGKDMKNVKEYIDDPMKTGIDFSMPLYVFMVGEETAGMTMKVNDEGDVKDFLLLLQKQGLASKPVEKDGLMCGSLVDDISYAYDSKSFLLLASLKGKGTSATNRMAHELMSLKEDDSFASTELEAFMPAEIDMKDLDAIMCLNFENGQASFKAKAWGKTDKAKALLDEADKNFGTIDGKYIERVSANTLVWMGANVKGEWALGKLKENKSIKEMLFMLERAVDIEQMLRAVDGDVALELQSEDGDLENMPEYVMYAELKNSDFLKDVDDWKASMKDYGISMNSRGDNQYALTMDGDSYLWGVQSDDLFLSSENAVRGGKGGIHSLAAHKDDIKKNKFYIYVDIEKIPLVDFAKQSGMSFLVEPLGELQSVVVKSSSIDEVTLTIELKDKGENFLKQLL